MLTYLSKEGALESSGDRDINLIFGGRACKGPLHLIQTRGYWYASPLYYIKVYNIDIYICYDLDLRYFD